MKVYIQDARYDGLCLQVFFYVTSRDVCIIYYLCWRDLEFYMKNMIIIYNSPGFYMKVYTQGIML